jgi:hypothetical protein
MLQAGRSRVPLQISFQYSTDLILPVAVILGSTQPLTEMSTRILPGGKERPVREADNLNDICESTYRKLCSLDISQPHGPSRCAESMTVCFSHLWEI